MAITIGFMLGCLLLAIMFTVVAERTKHEDRERPPLSVYLAVFALYAVCIGLAASLLVCFLSLTPWVSLALGVPLAVPMFAFLIFLAQ
jgi:hypothetical protein